MSPTSTTLRRTGTVAALALAGVMAAAGAACAHVTVHPESYAKGATDGVLSFRVPNEEDTASTTKVQVFLPTDHPVLGVLVTPQAGWTAKVTTTKLKKPVKTDDGTITDAVSEITWTGGRIRHGEFQDFDVAFGQLPDDTGRLTFKTLQTYSDGKVVRWIEEAKDGADGAGEPRPRARAHRRECGGGGWLPGRFLGNLQGLGGRRLRIREQRLDRTWAGHRRAGRGRTGPDRCRRRHRAQPQRAFLAEHLRTAPPTSTPVCGAVRVDPWREVRPLRRPRPACPTWTRRRSGWAGWS